MIHKGLTQERWNLFSMVEQLANVGADVGRVIRGRNQRDQVYSDAALDRALELLDLSIADPKNKKFLKELLRVRETLVDYFMYDNEYGSSDQLWEDYFYCFGYAAAIQRGR